MSAGKEKTPSHSRHWRVYCSRTAHAMRALSRMFQLFHPLNTRFSRVFSVLVARRMRRHTAPDAVA
eukprot:2434978-Rhodomonas_salina.1